MSENAKERIQKLSKELSIHNYAYYVLAEPTITDREFDFKLKELESLENSFPQYKSNTSPTVLVGGGITKEFETIKHSVPMLSLGNTYTQADLLDFDKRVRKVIEEDFYYTCELKFDGLAIALRYVNGKLTKAITRGDGQQGDDVTTNIKTIRSIPQQLKGDYPSEVEVRGEIFMHKKAFERLNSKRIANGKSPFANPRNSAAGTIKMQDQSEVAKRPLDCFLYHLTNNSSLSGHYESLKLAKSWNLPIDEHTKKVDSMEAVWAFITYWQEERKKLSFEIDGIVIKVNNYNWQEELGFTSKNPRWAISYKFETEQASTLLDKITYQVGRTGAVTPVANLKPVLLLGTTIRRASLHNSDIIEQLDVREGDTVVIEKGGEIIPKIVSVNITLRSTNSIKTTFITHCPECNTLLTKKEEESAHYCPNEMGCKPQITGKLEHFISRKALQIDSLGEGKIDMLYEHELVKNAADLYDLTYEDIIGLQREITNSNTGETKTVSFREKTANNIIKGIADSKNIAFSRVLYGLGIRFVGSTIAKKLVAHYENIEPLMKADYEELIQIPEIGEQIAKSLIQYFSTPVHAETINRLKANGLNFEEIKKQVALDSEILLSKKIIVSGVFSAFTRSELKVLIEKNGGINSGSLSSKTDYLIAGEKMGPSKRAKAEKHKITIIDEQAFIKMIGYGA